MENTALAQIQQVDSLLPTVEVLKQMKVVADYMVSAKMLPPGYKGGEDLMVIGLRGRELGVSIGQAVQGMFPMQGRIGYMGGFLSSMVKNRLPYSDIRIKESTKEKCVLEWRRTKEEEYQTEEYSMEEVIACHYNMNPVKDSSTGYQKQDASGNLLWKPKAPWGDPKNMLYWRCLTRTINRWFSDVFGSPVYTADEIQDMEVIDIPATAKAAASVPYATVANTPEESKPVVTEIVDAELVPSDTAGPIVTEEPAPPPEVLNSEPPPPEPKGKMSQPMIDALVLQFEKDIQLPGLTKRDIEERFGQLKTCGLPGKVLTSMFHLKVKRLNELGVKK